MSSLILSGWTQPVDSLSVLDSGAATFDYSDFLTMDASFDGLKRFDQIEHVIAWSLGGQVALRAIMAGVLKPKHLTLIATPYQFVRSHSSPPRGEVRRGPSDGTILPRMAPPQPSPYGGGSIEAMDPLTFYQFRTNYLENPKRTKTRFHALVAKGDSDAERILAALHHHPHVEKTARWLPWLDELSQYSFVGADFSRVPPTLIVHGENDAIVSFTQAALFAKSIPLAESHLWTDAGHAPHLHDAARLQAIITDHRARMSA